MTSGRPKPDIESSIWIARPPKDIWDYLAVVSTDTQWRAGVLDAKWISEPPHEVGSTGLHIIERVGDWPWTVTEYEAPRIMAWEVTGGKLEGSQAAYRMEPEGDGSHFTMEMRFKRSLMMRFRKLLMSGTIQRGFDTDVEKLKAILES